MGVSEVRTWCVHLAFKLHMPESFITNILLLPEKTRSVAINK
jgi:uncharacterized protein YceK